MSKQVKKIQKIKIPALFKKTYTDAKYQKKILAKLYVEADKKLVESVFHTVDGLHTIDPDAVKDKKQAKQLARIAKEIKKQKGRFNIGAIAAALVCVVALVLALTVFRNQIARFVIVSSLESAFAAKCEIKDLDINLLDTQFLIEGLTVANRNEPMKNLFGIDTFDLHFNLLELTRGKVVAETVEITGVSWNTPRQTSGALPPKKLKKALAKQGKPNPVMQKITAEFDKLKSGVSLDSGIGAVMDQLDPAKLIEKEKAALKAPAIITEIKSTVPGLTAKWKDKNTEVRKQTETTAADVKKIAALKPASINTIAEVQSALSLISSTSTSVKNSVTLAGDALSGANTDLQTVTALSKSAEEALKSDGARLASLAGSVKDINLGTGKKLLSSVFDTFVANTLGVYYPYLNQGLSMMKGMQNGQKKEASLKKKSSAVARLPGRTFVYGNNSMPQFVLRDVRLSAGDSKAGMNGSGSASNITNNQDQLGKPTAFTLSFMHGKMSEDAEGTLDLRVGAEKTLDSKLAVNGYALSIPSTGTAGVPSVTGTLGTDGTLTVLPDGTVKIETILTITDALIATDAFEPAFLYKAYRDTLKDIKTIDLDVTAVISPDGGVSVSIDSAIDSEIAKALQAQINQQVEQVKKDIQKYAENWIADQRKEYSSEIAQFTEQANVAKKTLEEAKGYEKTLDSKKAELEKRAAELATKAAAPVQKAATDAIKKLW